MEWCFLVAKDVIRQDQFRKTKTAPITTKDRAMLVIDVLNSPIRRFLEGFE